MWQYLAFIGYQANQDASQRSISVADAFQVNMDITKQSIDDVRETDLETTDDVTLGVLKQITKSVSEVSTYRDF